VEALRELFPAARVFSGEAATESQARSLSADLDVIHFAVHAVLDADQPQRSALVLSLPNEPARSDRDGFFEAGEIRAALRLNATLVTLSACETALGREMGGEGLVGLAQAFQVAGARSVLASLWPIADRPTARLMRLFYAELRAGRTKDEALRQAQLALLRDPVTSHPANWAGLLLIGDYL
jgi:CHAT domain-containing protein